MTDIVSTLAYCFSHQANSILEWLLHHSYRKPRQERVVSSVIPSCLGWQTRASRLQMLSARRHSGFHQTVLFNSKERSISAHIVRMGQQSKYYSQILFALLKLWGVTCFWDNMWLCEKRSNDISAIESHLWT